MRKSLFDEKAWQRSVRCGEAGHCVEVQFATDKNGRRLVGVRDSKNPEAGPLVFDAEEWDVFRQGVIAGNF